MKTYRINFNSQEFEKYNNNSSLFWKSVNDNPYSELYRTKHSFDEYNLVKMEIDIDNGAPMLETKCNKYTCASNRFTELLLELNIIQEDSATDFKRACNQYMLKRGGIK